MQVSTEVVIRLRVLLAGEGVVLPDGVRAVRCHHSAADRSNGAWSWTLRLPHDLPAPSGDIVSCIGSHWPMRDLVRCRNWELSRDEYGSIHADLCAPCATGRR